MNLTINTCSQREWAVNSLKMHSSSLSIENYLTANILSSLQFLPEDKDQMKTQAYSLSEAENISVAWMNVYFISKNVVRIRGLYVLDQYRNLGYMSFLLNEVLKKYSKDAKKVLSFSRQNSILFHEKNNFSVEPNFQTRTMTLYNSDSKIYYHDPDGEITLMVRYL